MEARVIFHMWIPAIAEMLAALEIYLLMTQPGIRILNHAHHPNHLFFAPSSRVHKNCDCSNSPIIIQ